MNRRSRGVWPGSTALLISVLSVTLAGPAVGVPSAPVRVAQPGASSGAEGCSFRPVYTTGRRLVYTFNSTTEVAASPPDGAGSGARKYVTELTLRFTTLGVDAHHGATFALLVDRVKLATTIEGKETVVVVTRQEAEQAEPLAEGAPLIDRLARMLADSAARIDVDSSGVVTDVSGFEAAQTFARENGAEGSRILGPLASGADQRTISMIFRADGSTAGGEYPIRKPGEKWELIDRIPMLDVADLVLTTSLTLEACSADEAKASGAVRTTVEPAKDENGLARRADPAKPTIEVTEQSDRVFLAWKPSAGVLAKRERTSSIVMSARLGSTRQNVQDLRTHSVIELVEVANP